MTAEPELSWHERADLSRLAMSQAIDARFQAGVSPDEPVPAWVIAERLGAPVRFIDIDMEGMYRREPSPRIFVSAQRPLPRRNFTCGHEIGHHVFGHGTTLENFQACAPDADRNDPQEFLANAFSAHLLMPVLGVRVAFSRRGIVPELATAIEILAVATEFGVGYRALVNQLTYSLRNISPGRRDVLLREYPRLRSSIVPSGDHGPVVFIDRYTRATTIDIEIGHLVVGPHNAVPDEKSLVLASTTEHGQVFRAIACGAVEISDSSGAWSVLFRVARKNFVGLARFLFLGDENSDEFGT